MKTNKILQYAIGGFLSIIIVGLLFGSGLFIYVFIQAYSPIPSLKDFVGSYGALLALSAVIYTAYYYSKSKFKYAARAILISYIYVMVGVCFTSYGFFKFLTPTASNSELWIKKSKKRIKQYIGGEP
jgi:hypothetical protein